MARRMDELDGLRAVAILWVALYHYAVFWSPSGRGTPILPYADALAWIPLAAVGGLGVSLFFIVSGLVITISLERSPSVAVFAQRRFLRLWPMMLLAATLTFVLTSALGPSELVRSVPEYLISLAFVPPAHVGRVLGVQGWEWLDGAYWSLWVEVRFYLFAAWLHFTWRGRFLEAWSVFAVLCAGLHVLGLAGLGWADALGRLVFAEYQPFLGAGVALSFLMRGRQTGLARAVLGMSVMLAFLYGLTTTDLPVSLGAGLTLVFTLGIGAALFPERLPWLAARPLAAMGRASYGYYLIHQNAGLALLGALPFTGLAAIGAMLIIQAGLLGLALLAYAHIERPLARAFRSATVRAES